MINCIYEKKMKSGSFRVFNQKPDFAFLKTKQIHSAIVVHESEINEHTEADGIVGNSINAKCILTADCLPIVIEGLNGHATLHAGWKGVRDEIVLNEAIKKLNAQSALIGPHICENCYEVQPEFKKNFENSKSFVERDGKLFFSLKKEIISQLKRLNPQIEIIDMNLCTMEDPSLHSFRKNKTEKRNYNIYLKTE